MMKPLEQMSDAELDALLKASHTQNASPKPLSDMNDAELDALLAKKAPKPSRLDEMGINALLNTGGSFVNSLTALPNLIPRASNAFLGTHLPQIPQVPSFGNPQNTANQFGSLVGNVLGYVFPTGALSKLGGTILPKVISRIGANALVGGAESPNFGEGAVIGGATQGALEGLAGLIPKGRFTRIAESAERGARGATGPIRSPAEAKAVLDAIGPDFKVSLGQLTRKPSLLERTALGGAGQSYLDLLSPSLTKTEDLARDISETLRGSAAPAEIPGAVQESLKNYHDSVRKTLDQLYSPLEQKATEAGFLLKDRPHVKDVYNQHFSQESRGLRTGSQLEPTIESKDLRSLRNILSPPEGADFSEARRLESQLKEKGREYGNQGKTSGQSLYNELAEALRKDYDAAIQKTLPEGIKEPLEAVNRFAKENYYDLFDNEIKNAIEGKKNVFSVLEKPKNRALLEKLPQETKHQIFYNKILGGGTEGTPSANQLMKAAHKGNTTYQSFKETLLSPEMKQKLDDLEVKNELTEEIGRSLRRLSHGETLPSSVYGLRHLLGNLAGNSIVARHVTRPGLIQGYANLENPGALRNALQSILRQSGSPLASLFINQGNT